MPLTGTNAELAPYKQTFYDAARSVGYDPSHMDRVELAMEFSDMYDNTNILGSCQRSFGRSTQAQIWINRKAWEKMDTLDKKALMFHELAHCLLNRGHLDTRINISLYYYDELTNKYVNPQGPFSVPASIMNKYHSSAYIPKDFVHYAENILYTGYYIEELFLNKEYEAPMMKMASLEETTSGTITHVMNEDGSCNHH